MSNRIYIEVVESRVKGDSVVYYDVKVSDDYAVENIYLDKELESDEQIFKYAVEYGGDVAQDIFTFASESDKGITIQDTYYEYSEWSPWYAYRLEWR